VATTSINYISPTPDNNSIINTSLNMNVNITPSKTSNVTFYLFDSSENLINESISFSLFNLSKGFEGTGTNTITGLVAVDDSIYIGLGAGNFGVYNITSNQWTNLNQTDSGNWVGTSSLNSLAFDNFNNLIYIGLSLGKFGVYNITSNIWSDLSNTSIGNWSGSISVNAVVYDDINKLIYTGGGKLGVYNITSNVWTFLGNTSTGNWTGGLTIFPLFYDNVTNLLYTGMSNGKLGVYNITSNIWSDLGNFISKSILSIELDRNNNLIYAGFTAGNFGVYNITSNQWINLNQTDSGNWAGISDVRKVIYDPINNLVYTGLQNGKFGVYNPIDNIWTDLSMIDKNNWLGTSVCGSGIYNNFNNLIYIGCQNGHFAVYSPSYFGMNYNLSNGIYYFNVSVIDSENNISFAETRIVTIGSGNVSIDNTNPNATLLTPANNSVHNTNQNFTVNLTDDTGLDNATLHIYNSTGSEINSTIFTSISGSVEAVVGIVVNLADGIYHWFFVVYDLAGNQFITQNNTVTINTAYAVQFVSPTDDNGDSYQRQNILINTTATGIFNAINIYIYNSTNDLIANLTSANSPFFSNYSTGNDGTYYFNATVCGDLGCNSTETRIVYLDTFNPVVDITYPDPDGLLFNYNIQTVNFTVLNTGTIQSCLISLNGGANISVPNCTEGITMSYTGFNSTEGLNTITVWANDTVGLYGSHTHNFTVDTIPPTIQIISPTNTTYISTFQMLNISSNGNTILYNWNGINQTYSGTGFITFNEGSNILNAYALDNAGNFNSTSVTFTVNTPVYPTLEIISPINDTSYNNASQLLDISSNGDTVIYNWNGTNQTYTSSITIEFAEGSNTLEVWAIENILNLTNYSTVSFMINTPIPPVQIPPTYLSSPIYQILSSSGSGLGIFIQLLAQALPLLLIGLAFAGIIIIIGLAFKKYLIEGGSP